MNDIALKNKYNILFKVLVASVVIAIALVTCFLGAKAAILFTCLALLTFALTKNEYMLMFLILFCAVFPKINLITIAETGVSVRFEDFVIAFVLFCVIARALLNRAEIKVDRIASLIFLFIGLSLLSDIFGVAQGTIALSWKSVLYFLRRIEYLSFFFVGYYLASKDSHKTVKSAMVIALFTVTVVAILQWLEVIGGYLQGNYIASAAGTRIFATFGHPTELGVFTAIVSIIVIIGLLEDRHKLCWLIAGSAGIYTLLAAGTRIVFISIPAGLAVMAVLMRKTRYVMIPLLMLVFFIMILPFFNISERFNLFLKTETIDNMQDIISDKSLLDTEKISFLVNYSPSLMDYSALIRVSIWATAFRMIGAHPILGLGQSVLGDFVDNNYLRILAENGIIVFMLFFLLIYNIWKQCMRTFNNRQMPQDIRNYALFILIMIVNLLVISMTFDVFESARIALLFWLFVGVFFGVRNIYKNEQQAELEENAA